MPITTTLAAAATAVVSPPSTNQAEHPMAEVVGEVGNIEGQASPIRSPFKARSRVRNKKKKATVERRVQRRRMKVKINHPCESQLTAVMRDEIE